MTVVTRNAGSVAIVEARRLAEAKAAGVQKINDAAGVVRERYITALPGQDMIYLAKKDEASAYLSTSPATLAGYPLLTAEVGITAPTAYQLSQLWLNMAEMWVAAAAQIESARLGAIAQVNAAATIQLAQAIAAAASEAIISA